MRREDISQAVGDLADRHVAEAAEGKAKRRSRKWLWTGAVAAVLAAAILCGTLFWPGGGAMKGYAIALAEYPEMAPYPTEEFYKNGEFNQKDYDAWWESRQAQRNWPVEHPEALKSFCAATMPEFLSKNQGKNAVYSPLNIWLALGMLAECTGGQSRAQILDLLGMESIETLRSNAAGLWNTNYSDDGVTTSILASSLWLNQDVKFVPETMDTLAKVYYASSFQGEMGSGDYNKALQDWLDQQTRGLLTEQASAVELDPQTILALATTVYFNAKWGAEFNEGSTTREVFHSPGGDVTGEFMHQSGSETYYWGERFGAVGRYFAEGGGMWFFLPDEGMEAEALLSDPQVTELLFSNYNMEQENSKFLIVNQSIPRFDVSGSIDLIDGLKELGITDVFDAARSDFTPMTADTDDVYLSQATHAARVKMDEKGVEAAAFTVMASSGSGMPPEEEVDFVLDRPFLFVITGASGAPLFIGVVNNPNG